MATRPQRRKKEKEEIAQEQLNLVHETEKKQKNIMKKLQNRRHGNCSSKRSQFCGKSVLKEAK